MTQLSAHSRPNEASRSPHLLAVRSRIEASGDKGSRIECVSRQAKKASRAAQQIARVVRVGGCGAVCGEEEAPLAEDEVGSAEELVMAEAAGGEGPPALSSRPIDSFSI